MMKDSLDQVIEQFNEQINEKIKNSESCNQDLWTILARLENDLIFANDKEVDLSHNKTLLNYLAEAVRTKQTDVYDVSFFIGLFNLLFNFKVLKVYYLF